MEVFIMTEKIDITKSVTMDTIARNILESQPDGKGKLTLSQITAVLNGFKDNLKDSIAEGKRIQITGILNVEPTYRGEREGNNVVTGEKMMIPEGVALNIKAGKFLKDAARAIPESNKAVFEALKAKAESKKKA